MGLIPSQLLAAAFLHTKQEILELQLPTVGSDKPSCSWGSAGSTGGAQSCWVLPRRRGCLCLFLPGAALVGDAAAEGNSLCCALFAHTSRLLLAKSKSHAEEAAPQQHLSTPEIILLFLNGKSFCLLHVLALPMSAWYIGEWCTEQGVGWCAAQWGSGAAGAQCVGAQCQSRCVVHGASPEY